MSDLRLGPRFTVPVNVVTETLGILAVKRAGKSNTAVVMAEAMYDAGLPWVAVDPKGDWWGIRAAGDGKAAGLEVVVFGGEHGDVPLEPTAGKLIADLVVDNRLTCVLDVSEMSKADMRRFLLDFAERLYKRNREPLHVFCEEADEYIPQRVTSENTKLVGAFETLVKRGGFRGIGVTLITQRSASLNKDVLTQVGTLIAMRTPSPQDRKAVFAWIDYHDTGREIVDELPTLENGTAWVISPEFLQDIMKVSFRRRRTFDSGATPEVGKKVCPPARLADVDLDAIRGAMAETIEKQKANDPRELQQRISRLEREKIELTRQLSERASVIREMSEHVCAGKEVEVPVLFDAHIASLEDATRAIHEALDKARELKEPVVTARQIKVPTPKELNIGRSRTITPAAREQMNTSLHRTNETKPVPTVRPREAVADSGEAKLGKTERSILTVLVIYGERTHRQIALQTGYSPKASTIGVALSKLRKMGLVEPTAPIRATQAGVEALGDYEPLPTGPALLEFWFNKLGGTEKRVLQHLLNCYPHETDLRDTAEATGYSPTASTIGVSMSKLRKLEIADGWKVSDDFMRSTQ